MLSSDLLEGLEVFFVTVSDQAGANGGKGDVGVIGVGIGKSVSNGFVVKVVSRIDRREEFESREIPEADQALEIAVGFEPAALGVVNFGEQSDGRNGCGVIFDNGQKLGFGFWKFPERDGPLGGLSGRRSGSGGILWDTSDGLDRCGQIVFGGQNQGRQIDQLRVLGADQCQSFDGIPSFLGFVLSQQLRSLL